MRIFNRFATTPHIGGNGFFLRRPEGRDYRAWYELRSNSRSFLEPWEPNWALDYLSRRSYLGLVRRYRADFAEGRAVPLFLFRTEDNALLGGLNIGNIRGGAVQSCMIGYWMGEEHSGQGWMLKAIEAVQPYIFETLRLHRIEAACIPENTRSVKLLEKAGFQYEGFLRGYLKINGRWRDHSLYALLAEDRFGERNGKRVDRRSCGNADLGAP
ncbi:GNAT family N-acetyltransferase [Hoeflea sp. WL0058]|uniref:GNAT family N-acetyltransferase n=1 Tax=Flavimaribacter sediminis TaxID=2865987 RepID=A0AAE3D2T5_9HYPH|nr:GNAT family protein [Flavimaribacter sediminis]MBW8640134.1 GNAT family N-acetyltransferase [Flavimaribacter sediminis]